MRTEALEIVDDPAAAKSNDSRRRPPTDEVIPPREPPTFALVAERVIAVALVAERRDPSRPTKSEERWRNALFNHAAVLLRRPIAEIGTDDILEVLEPIWLDIPCGARKTREHLSRVFAYAIARGQHPGPNPARWRDHLDQLLKRRAPVPRHHAALHHRDAPDFLARLQRRRGVAAAALQFVLFTGARAGEVQLATWDEIDWDQRLWMVPREHAKENGALERLGRSHKRIPLADPVLALLLRLRERSCGSRRLIFSCDGDDPISCNAMLKVIKLMGLKGVTTTHGLRSTFRDWTAEQRIRLPSGRLIPAFSHAAAEISLGHTVGSAVERAYHRSDHLEERIDLMREWATYLCDSGTDGSDLKVLPPPCPQPPMAVSTG